MKYQRECVLNLESEIKCEHFFIKFVLPLCWSANYQLLTMKNEILSEAEKLRQKAQEAAKKRFSVEDIVPSATEMLKLIQELEVHQIELEMQGEELARTKEQLEASSEKYAELYDFALPGYFTLSREARIVELNLSGAAMLGKERSHLINSKFDFFVSDDSKSIFNSFLDKVFYGKVLEDCEVKLLLKGSLVKNVYLTGIMAENGNRCLIYAFDITRLKRSEEQLKTILHTTIDGFYLFDTEGRILDTNDSCCSMIGYSRKELLKMKVKDIEVPDSEEGIQKRMYRILENGYDRFETRYLRKDGSIIIVEASVNLLIDKQPRLFCFMRDITERKKAEEALRESEVKYRKLHESLTDAFVVVDMQGRIQDYNRDYIEMLGYNEAELEKMTYIDLTPVRWHEFEAKIVKDQVLTNGYSDIYEKEYRRKDGTVFPVELRNFLIKDDTGRPTHRWAIVRDISQRKQAEQELINSKEKTEENEIKLQGILDTMQDAFFQADLNGNITFVNHSAVMIYGYSSASEMMGIPAYDLYAERRERCIE
jgi:PAS domain S-box-containing protein